MAELVFDADERTRMAASPHLRAYASVTKSQVLGLLHAIANYTARIIPDDLPLRPEQRQDPQLLAAHGNLVGRFRSIAALHEEPDPVAQANHEGAVFSASEQEHLRFDKYLQEVRGITQHELLSLLEALDRYADVAPRYDFLTHNGTLDAFPVVGFNRCVHAHNALVDFRHRVFTQEEFVESLHRTVLSPTPETLQTKRPWWRFW